MHAHFTANHFKVTHFGEAYEWTPQIIKPKSCMIFERFGTKRFPLDQKSQIL